MGAYGSLLDLVFSMVQWKCNVSHAFNFTFSSNHINKARKGGIDFDNIY